MANNSDVIYCDSAVNPVMGCDGCELWNARKKTCYAGIMHDAYRGTRGWAPEFTLPTTFLGRVEDAAKWKPLTGTLRKHKPWLDGLPRIIFVSDMGDALSNSVTFDWLKLNVIDPILWPEAQRHVFLWSTKRARRMLEFHNWLSKEKHMHWPVNLWPMTTLTSRKVLQRAEAIAQIDSPVRIASVEPMLEAIPLAPLLKHFQWVILGGESGNGKDVATTELEWFEQAIGECRTAGVACFMKQTGTRVTYRGNAFPVSPMDLKGERWDAWPDWMKIRQMPIRGVIQEQLL